MATPLDYGRRDTGTPGCATRVLATPVGWPLAAAAVGATVLTINADTAASDGPWARAVLAWAAVGVIWAARLVAGVAARRRLGRPGWIWGQAWQYAVVPAVAMLAAFFAVSTIDSIGSRAPAMTGALRTSHLTMEQVAIAALANPSVRPPSVVVGSYGPIDPEVHASEVYFPVTMEDLIYGYDYSPNGPPKGWRPCRHIDGPWYWCGRKW